MSFAARGGSWPALFLLLSKGLPFQPEYQERTRDDSRRMDVGR